jgi:AcrR family transcriptional regulator
MTRATPRQKRHEDIKHAILWAARTLILEKGSDKLSLREIARRIGHSPAGLYEYFGSKEEIVAAVAAEALDHLSNYLGRVPASLPPARRLVELGLAYVEFARQHPEHFLLVFSSLISGRVSPQAPADARSPYRIVQQAVRDGFDTGDFAPHAGYGVEEIAYSLWAFAHGMAMLQQTHLRQFQADFKAADRHALETFVAGLKSA